MKLKLLKPFHYENIFIDFFIQQGTRINASDFFKSFVDCLLYPKKLLLIGTDDFLINRYLDALQFKIGKFLIYTAGEGEFDSKGNMDGLVIKGINKISKQEQTKLFSLIKQTEYYHKRLIFVSSEPIEINGLEKIEIVQVPTSDQIKKLFPSFYESSSKLEWKRLDKEEDKSSDDNSDENQIEYDNKQPPYQFIRRKNNKIRIIFKGKESALRNEDLLGLHFLRIIIKYGRNGISYHQIERTQYDSFGQEQEKKNLKDVDFIDEEEDDEGALFTMVDNFPAMELLDEQSIDEIRDAIDHLENKLKIAKDEFNFEEMGIIEDQIKKLKDYLNKSLDISGKKRKTNTELYKIKRRVKKNIKAALDNIKVDDGNLYSFLNKSIKIDKNTDKYIYTPDPSIEWDLD